MGIEDRGGGSGDGGQGGSCCAASGSGNIVCACFGLCGMADGWVKELSGSGRRGET